MKGERIRVYWWESATLVFAGMTTSQSAAPHPAGTVSDSAPSGKRGVAFRKVKPVSPYVIAVVSVIAMTAVRVAITPLLGNEFPFITFFAAVFLTAWYGGLWPTILATVLGAILSTVLVIAPVDISAALSPVAVTGLLLFLAIGLATGWLGESRLRQQARAALSAEAAHQAAMGQQLEQLVVGASALITEVSLERVLEQVVEVAAEVIGAHYAAIGVLGPDGRLLESFITHGIDEEQRALIGPPPRGHGILGLVIREARPIRLPDLSRHPDSYGFPPHHPPMHSFLGVPIVGRRGTFGNLYLTEKFDGELFTEEDEHVAVLLAANTAAAVENTRLHEESAQLLEEVQQLHRARERFFAMVNHELRNALAAVYGWSEMMVRKKDPATVPRAAFEVLDSAQQAVGLVNDLLDLSRLDEDRLRPVIRATDPAALARRAIARMTPAAQSKRILLQVEVEPNLPSCETDASRVEQILVNLLRNAIDHAPDGTRVTIDIALRFPWIAFTIEDRGEGIPESDIERIFDIYVTKASEESRGVGLGLPLSRRLARLLKGELRAIPRPGGGGCFVLELPASAPEKEVSKGMRLLQTRDHG
jgi:signal transduction histidine kinase